MEKDFSPTGSGEWSVGKITATLKEWAQDHKNRSSGSGSSLQRGSAFYSTENSDQEDEDKNDQKTSRKRSRQNNKNKSNKKQAIGCIACGLPRHTVKECWIAIPELRPDWHVVNKDRLKETNKKIDKTLSLKAKVNQLRQQAAKSAKSSEKQEKSVTFSDRITELN